MIGQNSLTHVSLSYRIGLDIIPLDTIPNTQQWGSLLSWAQTTI